MPCCKYRYKCDCGQWICGLTKNDHRWSDKHLQWMKREHWVANVLVDQ